MKKLYYKKIIIALVAPILIFISLPAFSGIVYGTAARAQFEGFKTDLGDTFIDFENITPLTNLTSQISGVSFATTRDRTWQQDVPITTGVNVVCSIASQFSSSCVSPDHHIVGVRSGNYSDGQSLYEIVFDTPQLRAGLARDWNTYSLTRFYSGTTLLAEHQNTTNHEFVGFIADSSNLITRIELDGMITEISSQWPRGIYQVGTADDLFFGNQPQQQQTIPEPLTLVLMLSGIGIISLSKRHH